MGKEKKKAGRPQIEIDEFELEKLAERQWTKEEIAGFFRCSRDTIERRFTDIIEQARQRGRAKLRDLQWTRALDGSDRVLIHMSQHYLDQHSKPEIKVQQTNMKTIEYEEPDGTKRVIEISRVIDDSEPEN